MPAKSEKSQYTFDNFLRISLFYFYLLYYIFFCFKRKKFFFFFFWLRTKVELKLGYSFFFSSTIDILNAFDLFDLNYEVFLPSGHFFYFLFFFFLFFAPIDSIDSQFVPGVLTPKPGYLPNSPYQKEKQRQGNNRCKKSIIY